MEILQLIFAVIAGLGAGAMGALLVVRRDDEPDRVMNLAERFRELEQRTSIDRQQLEQLTHFVGATDSELRGQLQAEFQTRDDRLDAVNEQLYRLESILDGAPSQANVSPHRFNAQLDTTSDRLATVEGDIARLEQRIQSRLIAFRESTQDVLRRLADHQVDEAERVTRLTGTTSDLMRRMEDIATREETREEDEKPTTAALVEVLETQFVLTERASALEDRVDAGLHELERHLADVETRLLTLDDLKSRIEDVQRVADEDERIRSLQDAVAELESKSGRRTPAKKVNGRAKKPVSLDKLEQIVGIGPKLARQLAEHGVPDIPTLAGLRKSDIKRLSGEVKGLKERQTRYDYVGQAKRLLERAKREQPSEVIEAAKPAKESPAAPTPTPSPRPPSSAPAAAPAAVWSAAREPDSIH